MATEQQYIVGGNSARSGATQISALAVNGANTVKGQIAVPANSWLKSIAFETPVTISGTPVSNVRVGITDGGQEIVADTQAHSQGHIAATIVAAFDKVAGLAANNPLFIQATTSGSGGLAGTINVLASYDPPAR
jgi:hypothetical protein